MSFLNPAFLLGLVALSIPIALHLMHREIPKRIIFPSIRFIFKGYKKQLGKRSPGNLFTLLIRCLILGLFILFFAEPIIRPSLPPMLSYERSIEIILFYDLSASMNAYAFKSFVEQETKRVFDKYKGAKFALLASSNKLEQLVELGNSPSFLLKIVKGLTPSRLKGNHQDALQKVPELFGNGHKTSKKMIIFSDIQRQDWELSALPPLGLDAEIIYRRPMNTAVPDNLAIMDVQAQGNSSYIQAKVQIHNFSLQPSVTRLTIAAGKVRNHKVVTIKGAERKTVLIDLQNPDGYQAIVALDSTDAYALDNHYFFWIGPRPALKIAILGEEDKKSSSEQFFLQNALEAAISGNERRYDLRILAPKNLDQHRLEDYECVFAFDLSKGYPETYLKRLYEYLQQGGKLVYFSTAKSRVTFTLLNKAGISALRFYGIESRTVRLLTIDQLDRNSPIVSLFIREPSDLFFFPVYKFVKLKLSKSAKSLLSFNNGFPFLIQESQGKGDFFCFTSRLDATWNELSTSLSFLPLIRQIVSFKSRMAENNIIDLVLGEPSSHKLAELGLDKEALADYLKEPGVYLVNSDKVLQVNITRAESDLRSNDTVAIRQRLEKKMRHKPVVEKVSKLEDKQVNPLYSLMAWGLIMLIFLEVLVANYQRRYVKVG